MMGKLSTINLLLIWNVVLTVLIIVVFLWALDLQTGQRNLVSNVEYNRDIIEVQNRAINENTADIAQCGNEISDLEPDIDSLQWETADLQWEVDDLEFEIGTLKRKISNLEWDIFYLKLDVDNLEWDISRLKFRL